MSTHLAQQLKQALSVYCRATVRGVSRLEVRHVYDDGGTSARLVSLKVYSMYV